MRDFLTNEETVILEEAHHDSRLRKSADRIKGILLLNKGYSPAQIAAILLLDEGTIRRYKQEYKKSGVDGLLENHYHGSKGHLSEVEEQELTLHLKEHIYQTVKEVVSYVEQIYHEIYSVEGMTHLLHRLHFSYK